jgi:hypothetical protein
MYIEFFNSWKKIEKKHIEFTLIYVSYINTEYWCFLDISICNFNLLIWFRN